MARDTLTHPGYRERVSRSEALDWLFEGPGYRVVTLSVDAALLIVAMVVADALNPAHSYLPTLLVSPLTVALLAWRRLYDPDARIAASTGRRRSRARPPPRRSSSPPRSSSSRPTPPTRD